MTLPRPLTPIELRVLGTLLEKARTVPDTYPLSLNLVVTGCNQKTSREPVMNVSEAQVQETLDDLKALSLAIESHGSRVAKYEHNLQRVLHVPDQSAVLLGLLMLRGPQTAGELRINADRWHRFADISSVEGFLNELAERPADKGGPLVVLLPRAPGAREARWAHLLAGPIDVDAIQTEAAIAGTAGAGGQFDRISALEAEVATLRETVARLCAELGVSPAQPVPAGGHAKNDESPETN
ncbi:MAG: YceH family protein [Ottowia sp.]|nr:YceH family protein [Ottowia sp.]